VTRIGRRRLGQIAAGAIVFVVLALPALLFWWAGSNGSLGDLSEIDVLGVGLVVALTAAVVAGWLMGRAFDIASRDPEVGRLDPWAALFVAVIVLSIAVTLVPAFGLVVLLPDENASLGTRFHWLGVIWIGGAALAAAASVWGARRVLVRSRRGSAR
jgi:hypothetical protein